MDPNSAWKRQRTGLSFMSKEGPFYIYDFLSLQKDRFYLNFGEIEITVSKRKLFFVRRQMRSNMPQNI